ncbi:NAD(P)/FAD-dependent oxidoreductase [Maribacter algicola]|uniref:NAD(P)/FAD-dependent oxidoreductase n=1 Tax=Meishania litoralis TaxID=3434685 RepID=A0ACC7LPQ6_9FLAO
MLDYLIVGSGLAGISFAETLDRNNKSFKVISDDSQVSSSVAAGLINPVILKRFKLVWKAKEQMALARLFYQGLEKKLEISLYCPMKVFRRFISVEEQNLWFSACDKNGLREFLSDHIHMNANAYIDAPFGFGEVQQTVRVNTQMLISAYREYLLNRGSLLWEKFNFDKLIIHENHIEYGSAKAKQIVFCEGFGIKENPYFNYLPIAGNKGEYVFVKAPELKLDQAIKSAIFCIPEGNDIYRIGANYDRCDETNEPTIKTKKELLKKWESIFKCSYEVIDQIAGIRPVAIDRRPVIGRHPKYNNLYVLNGFGSRGVLIAPYASKQLYGHIENEEPIATEMYIARFNKKHYSG